MVAKIGAWLRASWLISTFGLAALVYLPLLACVRGLTARDRSHRNVGRLFRRFGRVVVFCQPGWKREIVGAPPSDIGLRAYVVVSNHRSAADPFLLSHVPWDMRWVLKRELVDLPVVGWLIRLSGDIPVDRSSRSDAVRMLSECAETLRSGLSVMLFPEGTRNETGVGAFKSGAFRLAIREGAPILPLAVSGTETWLDRRFRPGAGRSRAVILPVIETEGLSGRDADALARRVQAAIEDALGGASQPSTVAAE
jgi:1-acyl-sn-glycerol-3-phosphate acyltransferase